MARGSGFDRVGALASSVGILAWLLGTFGEFAPSRISAGVAQRPWEAIGALSAVPLLLWVGCLALSFLTWRRAAMARGWLSAGVIVSIVWLAGVAADRWVGQGDSVARYSIGSGAWASVFSAFALLMASSKAVGARSWTARVLRVAVALGLVALVLTGRLHALGIAAEYRNVASDFWVWVGMHLLLAFGSVTVAAVVATGLGIIAHRHARFAEPLLGVTSFFQTIPGLAMIGILAVPLGMLTAAFPAARRIGIGTIGWAPVVIALTLYALLVIARNTYAGLQSVPQAVVEAGRGMGLSAGQLLRKIELPLAAPVLFSGVRIAVQQTIGNATLGVFVAAATLGRPIFGGVSQTANDLILLGSITLVVIALLSDIALRGAEVLLQPRNLRVARR